MLFVKAFPPMAEMTLPLPFEYETTLALGITAQMVASITKSHNILI